MFAMFMVLLMGFGVLALAFWVVAALPVAIQCIFVVPVVVFTMFFYLAAASAILRAMSE
jgi:hypothetical protein